MPPKEPKPAAAAGDGDLAGEREALMESELVTAVLRSRLGRYQAAGEKLATENFCLVDELAKQKLTLQDINEFLTNELKARSLAAAQLEERVSQLNSRLADVQKEAQAELARARAEAAAEAAKGRAAAAALTASADAAGTDVSTADLAGQKVQLERTVAELRTALSARQREFDSRLSDMERRHLQDKEKMRKEAAAKIRDTKTAMAQLADQHLESSTKRTLVENETMVAELAYHTAQSHDLVAANNTLRAEAAELRRQVTIAHKTVESTAHKNLLLQQTIKSILTCLREEACQSAEAAGAAHGQQQQQQQRAPHSDTEPVNSAAARFDCTSAGSTTECEQQGPLSLDQQQQEQEQSDPLMHLEGRVVQLVNELTAAKQALAAALQGTFQQELNFKAAVCLKGGQAGRSPAPHDSAAAASAAAAPCAGPASCCQNCGNSSGSSSSSCSCTCCARGSKSSPASPVAASSRSRSPAAGQQQQHPRVQQQRRQQQHQQQQQQHGSSCQPGPMEAALQDGVAAFVLYAVQQLRRGTASTAAAAAATVSGGTSSCSGSGSKAAKIRQSGASAAAASAACTGTSRAASPMSVAAAAAGNGRATPEGNFTSRGMGRMVAAAEAAGADSSTGDMATQGGGASAEQLARFLLEQLHSYSRQRLAVYDGLTLRIDDGQQHEHCRHQQENDEEECGGAAVSPGGSSSTSVQQIQEVAVGQLQWPAAPLLHPTDRATSPAGLTGAGSSCAGADLEGGHNNTNTLQLRAHPSLLNNMGGRKVVPGGLGQLAVAAADTCRGGGSKSPSRQQQQSLLQSPTEGLFGAVLSELRPWGSPIRSPTAVQPSAGSITPPLSGTVSPSGKARAAGGLHGGGRSNSK